MKTFLMVFIGGGAGSVLRYLLSLLMANIASCAFPVGTFLCNIFGCFLIGLFNALAGTMGWENDTRLMLTVGLCGGFTTFSTFSNEGLAMLHSGNYVMYAAYLLASVVLGLLAVLAGIHVAG